MRLLPQALTWISYRRRKMLYSNNQMIRQPRDSATVAGRMHVVENWLGGPGEAGRIIAMPSRHP